MACPLATERVWIEKAKYHDAEKDYFEHLSKLLKGSLNDEIVKSDKKEKDKKKKKKKKKKSKFQDDSIKNNDVLSTTTEQPPSPSSSPSSLITVEKSSSGGGGGGGEVEDIKISNDANDIIDDASKIKKKKKINNKTGKIVTAVGNDSAGTGTTNNPDDENKPQPPRTLKGPTGSNQSTLVSEIAKARQHIKSSLKKMNGIAALAASPGSSPGPDILESLAALERENASLRELAESLKKSYIESEKRIQSLENRLETLTLSLSPTQKVNKIPAQPPKVTPVASSSKTRDNDDDDVDLFGSDSEGEDTEADKIREQRLAEYAAKKSKKPALIAKSSIILDVKPWDDETDLKVMETEIRKIHTDGLLWGASKLVPVAFGIKKLSISCVVEDDKVSIDWLSEEIEKLEDYVQSVDVAAFNKI